MNFFDRCHLELCPISFDSSLIPRLSCVGRESGNETKSVICDRSPASPGYVTGARCSM